MTDTHKEQNTLRERDTLLEFVRFAGGEFEIDGDKFTISRELVVHEDERGAQVHLNTDGWARHYLERIKKAKPLAWEGFANYHLKNRHLNHLRRLVSEEPDIVSTIQGETLLGYWVSGEGLLYRIDNGKLMFAETAIFGYDIFTEEETWIVGDFDAVTEELATTLYKKIPSRHQK